VAVKLGYKNVYRDPLSFPQWQASDLPVAPAITVGEEIVVEGTDVDDHAVETVICRCLGLPEPSPPKKGFKDILFGKQL
jgi:hypothetical protein